MNINSPSYLLPKTFLSKKTGQALHQHGIVNAHQLAWLVQNHPNQISQLLGCPVSQINDQLLLDFGKINKSKSAGFANFSRPPLNGLMSYESSESQELENRRMLLTQEREILAHHLLKINDHDLPNSIDLTSYLPDVGNQGCVGSCVGWGATCSREFPIGVPLSSGYAWREAKSLDGRPDTEGTWLQFAFEHFYLVGHIEESIYSYQDALDGRPIEPLQKQAARYKIDGFVDVLLDDMALMPTLLKGLLCGKVIPEIGPQPVSIGIALFESLETEMAYRTGMLTIPLPGEQTIGGHAMAIVGYIDKAHPDNYFGHTYFIVRNSWGKEWAAENPFGHPGHALIPANYFSKYPRLAEAVFSLAEASPYVSNSGLYSLLWEKTKQLLH